LEKYKRLNEILGYDYQTKSPNELDDITRVKEYLVKNNMIVDTIPLLHDAIKSKKRILAEGANATLLDLDFGTYPYVTSSSTSIGGVMTGLGIPPRALETVVGIAKAYTTRVGSGPFPSECIGEETPIGEDIRKRGFEFGSTTGRPRRVGWFDVNVLKYSHMINHFSSINLTKLDILSPLKQIKIVTNYKYKGQLLNGAFPANLEDLEQCETVHETLPGWESDISGISDYAKLPTNCKKYVERVEELIGIPISWIGTGVDRKNTIMKHL